MMEIRVVLRTVGTLGGWTLWAGLFCFMLLIGYIFKLLRYNKAMVKYDPHRVNQFMNPNNNGQHIHINNKQYQMFSPSEM